MQLAFHSQGASRMVRFFQWPWTTGQCSSPYCIHNKPMPIIQCWFCYLQYCEECDRITACYRCGKPACAYCYQAHDCQPEDLLSRHPWLKCRICPAPQDRVQPACEECGEPPCIDSQCCSNLRTSHCSHHKDVCEACASWQLVWRQVLEHPRRGILGVPTPLRHRKSWWVCERRYICWM